MTIKLDKESSHKERQRKLLEIEKKRLEEKLKLKKKIVESTFGSVAFDDNKTASEIYKEIRDEWY